MGTLKTAITDWYRLKTQGGAPATPAAGYSVIYEEGGALKLKTSAGVVTAFGASTVDDTAYDATSWDGVTTIAPSKNAVRDKFQSLTSPSYSRVGGYAGYGSTNTKILRFTTVVESSGTDITLTQSAGNGDSWTINTAGVYAMSAEMCPALGGGCFIGISINSNQLTTAVWGITAANRLIYSRAAAIASDTNHATCSVTKYLAANDVIRCHTAGEVSYTASEVSFTIQRVA